MNNQIKYIQLSTHPLKCNAFKWHQFMDSIVDDQAKIDHLTHSLCEHHVSQLFGKGW